MKLGSNILRRRKQMRISQEELAARVGVSRQAVSKWELDEAVPELEKLVSLAGVFGVTVDELLREEQEPEPDESGPADPGQLNEEKAGEPSGAAPPPGSNPPTGGDLSWIPGFLRSAVMKYGWLVGVYMAVSGLITAAAGGIFSAFVKAAFSAVNSFGGDMYGGDMGFFGGGIQITSSASLSPGEISAIQDALGVHSSSPFAAMNPVVGLVQGVGALIVVIGIVLMICGIILAVILWKKGHDTPQ